MGRPVFAFSKYQFSKYQGLGNDFLLIDGRSQEAVEQIGPDPEAEPFGWGAADIRRLCDRRFGIGADGLILALPPRQGGELRMRIFNADGSEPEMCGNGIRCLARFLADSDGDAPGRTWQVETLAGRMVPLLLDDGAIRVDMGPPFLEPAQVPTSLEPGPAGLPQGELSAAGRRFTVAAAGMGNPHVVIPVEDVAAVELERFGPALENHSAFPARTNVHFVQRLAADHLVMRVWERGAGPTLACGTGACATLVAAHLLGLCDRQARLDLPGGSLSIAWDGASGHVFMSGPAEGVFDAVINPALLGGDGESPAAAERPGDSEGPAAAGAAIDCATACIHGCLQPDDCPSAEARARVAALLASSSLDDLVGLANDSLEARTRARFEKEFPA